MRSMSAREKFELVMTHLMRAGENRLIGDAFGASGLEILNDFESSNGFKITPPGSWTNQAGLTYVPLGLISKDREGYFFTESSADSINWTLSKLPKGLNLKWIAKNFLSLKGLIEEIFLLREQVHSFLLFSHVLRQPEFRDPNGLIKVGIQIAHIIDAQLLGGRSNATMIDAFLTTATSHAAHSFFSCDNFIDATLTAVQDPSGDIIVKTDVINPGFHHSDCIRQDIIHAEGLTAEDSIGLLKMFAFRKILQQSRTDILQKWEKSQAV